MEHLAETLHLLVWPLAACVCIGLLHAYAGLHVLRRGIIFVDLALAQMAALGGVVGGFLESHEHHAPAMTHAAPASAAIHAPKSTGGKDELDAAMASIQAETPPATADPQEEHEHEQGALPNFWPTAFALGGAVLLSFSRLPGERVPHEALIGVVYVVAAAATVLLLSKSAHAHEQMEEMLTGRLLFVDRDGVLATAGLYAVLGVLHIMLRKPFIAISTSVSSAEKAGVAVRLWDCVFYAMFALMVTRSVAIGGVLVVFSFLIIPGACAALFAGGWLARLLIAWLVAVIVSVAGLVISAAADLPSGSTLVATFGGVLLISILIYLFNRGSRDRLPPEGSEAHA